MFTGSSAPSPEEIQGYNSLRVPGQGFPSPFHPKHHTLQPQSTTHALERSSYLMSSPNNHSNDPHHQQPITRPLQQNVLPYKTTTNYQHHQNSPRSSTVYPTSTTATTTSENHHQWEGNVQNNAIPQHDSKKHGRKSQQPPSDNEIEEHLTVASTEGKDNSAFLSTLHRKK